MAARRQSPTVITDNRTWCGAQCVSVCVCLPPKTEPSRHEAYLFAPYTQFGPSNCVERNILQINWDLVPVEDNKSVIEVKDQVYGRRSLLIDCR